MRRPRRTLAWMSAGSSASRKARTSARKDSSSAVKLRFIETFSFDGDDDFAARVAGTEPRDRVHSLLQRVVFGDGWPDTAFQVECDESRDVGGMPARLAGGELSPEYTDDLTALQQRQIERWLG